MKYSFSAQRVLTLFFFLLTVTVFTQNSSTQDFFLTKVTVTYSNGTPVDFQGAGTGNFGVNLNSAPGAYASYVSKLSGQNITIKCLVEGTYTLSYLGMEIAQFNVTKTAGGFNSNLPATLHFPFNYFIITDTVRTIYIYDESGNKTGSVTTNKQGFAPLNMSGSAVRNSFFVCYYKDHFPQIKTIGNSNPKYKNKLTFHQTKFRKPSFGQLTSSTRESLGNSIIHNIDKGMYYRIINLRLPSKPSSKQYYWLLVYSEQNNRASAHLLDFNGELFLDENGKAVLVHTIRDNQGNEQFENYFVNDDGSLQASNNSYVSPVYRFKGNLVNGSRWLVPVFLGEPMQEGQHTFNITCIGKNGDKMTSNMVMPVVFSPEKGRLLYQHPDGSLNDYPIIRDPKIDFDKLGDLKQCKLTVDGKITVDYTHTDMSMAKNIFYSDMSEQEKREANKNLPVLIGWDEDYQATNTYLDLFYGSEYKKAIGPLNRFEGPYPKLRYIAFKPSGEYATYDEAAKHCKKPEHGYKKYRCYEEHLVEVCIDNYRTVNDGDKKIPDFKALFCGEGTEDNNKGDQIVFEVEKPGYATKTGALSKRSMQASGFTLTGTVVDKQGKPVKEAKIKFRDKEGFVYSDSTGRFVIKTNGEGNDKEPFKEEVTIQLTKIGLTIYNEELGKQVTDTFGIVSDGFTTLKLKVIANGVEPRTVSVKQPALGAFTGHTMLNLPLVMDEDGTGSMEYVPPEYITPAQLNKHLKLKTDSINQSGLAPMLWVAEVPVTVTYEDEEGNPGSQTFIIHVTRPPVMLIHGFTGDETTWATLANYLRGHKYETIVREYYKGPVDESTIERQAEKLGKYIQELRADYLTNGFLQNRMDIVAHSMGGLISRYYISNMAKYGKTAGIYIPYNVKLSRDQIKAQRYQRPVVLNDVRKLIMVGTPNHGASPIDERIGYWSSKITGYHQIASAQLRSDSPFFEKLNAGESEGRHLDPNVQYALIYGIRKRSAFYLPDSWFHTLGTSQKEFASDDGVVTISSAKLNGVKDFPFPKDWFAIHGYIHSPAIQPAFPEDEPITESTNIFEKIDELLLEDIPRMPLKNSSAKIIRARGDVHYRYFSTQNWIPLKTPFSPGNAKKLENNWCRIKTGDGSAELGFFLNGHQWGALYIMPNTIAYYEYASPEFVNVYIRQGKARFRSRKMDGGSFQIVLGNEGEKWYAFNPKAKVMDMNTDFTVESENGSAKVQSIYGMVAVGAGKKEDKQVSEKAIGKKQGIAISGSGTMTGFEVPDEGWWSSVDTTYLPDDTTGLMQDSNSYTFDVGAIELKASDSYLPVAGFSTLLLRISHIPDTLLKAELVVKQQNKMLFIDVTNPDLLMDSLGSVSFNVTIDEPVLPDSTSLADLPLQVVFKATIMLESTGQVLAEKELSLPIGMTLLTGKTVDPGFKPRKQPSPPELYPISFQLANQADDKGNFYILFNTTLFDKEIEKLKKFAERTGKPFDKSSLRLLISWSENCSLPLTYELPDSVTNALKAGATISIGHHGNFDLITPDEHELRIKKYVEEFATNIPLNDEAKTYLFSKLDKLQFNYNVKSISIPTFSDNLTYSGTIDIPVSKKDFWGSKINQVNDPAYTLVFHVMGHFLQQAILLHNRRYFNFLAEKCSGSKYLFTRQVDELKYLFDNAAYVSFNEAGADFFAYLLYQYLDKKHPEFAANSIYSHRGYIDRLVNKEDAINAQKKYPPWLISGSQTSFLINYYGDECTTKPTAVFSDFLLNSLQFEALTRGADPAGTINRWILSKHLTYKLKRYAGNTDPDLLAEQFKLFNKNGNIQLIPRSDFSRATLAIDNGTVTDFRQIPAATVQQGTRVDFGRGHFVLLIPSRDTVQLLEADSACVIEVENNNRIKLLEGTLYMDAPVRFKTSLADFIPSGNDFQVTVTPKLTTIFNNNGVLKIVSEKDEDVVPAGFATTMSKKGNLKKPKPPKKEVPQRFVKSTTMPFVF